MDASPLPEAVVAPPATTDDWVMVPVRRGVREVEPILRLCDRYGGAILGGYARYCCSPRATPAPPGDVDVFPCGEGDGEAIFGGLYRGLLGAGFTPISESRFSVSFAIPGAARMLGVPSVQLIKPLVEGGFETCGPMSSVLGRFDFSVTCVGLGRDRRVGVAHRWFLADELAMRLRVMWPADPTASVRRAARYSSRGYAIGESELRRLQTTSAAVKDAANWRRHLIRGAS
ncbi:MAG: hypothetical protein H6747_01860 [Deltaproteobacteria bacterium]|nr:hypothetical protein [Deltaproteobacteria bacterium]